jgi:Carboxypeptidase regulatory-like domain
MITRRVRRLLLICVGLTFALAGLARAQVISGDIVGTVSDKSGASIPNATITAENVATGVKTTTNSDDRGEYRFANLLVGKYTIRVSAPNFATTTISNFEVELNKTNPLPVTLDVGAQSSTVEVTSVAPAIDTTTAQVGTTYQEGLQDFPTAAGGSGVLNLSLLQAGVASSGGIGAGSGPSVGGQRPRDNNFTIEGVDNNDKGVTGPLLIVPNDAVQEFSVLQNAFSPEFGHSNGGQFNEAIKSGSNSFHGAAYEYLQNRNLNAVDESFKRQGIFSNPRYDNNRFGGNVGGPIIKNKAFFFVDYEYNPIGQASSTSAAVITPTANGYTTLGTISAVSGTNLSMFQKYVPAAPSPCTAAQVSSGVCPGLTTSVGGVPVEIGVLPLASPNYKNNRTLVTSGDVNISGKDQIRVRELYYKQGAIDNAPELPVFFTTLPTVNHFATIAEYHTFSPRLINEFRVGFHRNTFFLSTGNFQFPGLDAFPNLMIGDLNLQVGPDPNGPQFGIQNLYQAIDNVTLVKGSHSFKFGSEIRKYISPQQFTQRSRGDYDYSTLDLYMRDLSPDQLGERSTGNSTYYGDQLGFYWYANDNWSIRRNLSVNIGLRYEYTTVPFTERRQTLNKIADAPGLMTFDEPQYPKNAFMPRVGFAYSPGANGKTSVRGSFGMGYDVLYDNIGILSLPPEFGSTVDVDLTTQTPNFLKNGGIPPGGSGLTTFPDAASARAATSNHVVINEKLPTAVEWSLGVQHTFWNSYSFEARYLGTHGYHLNVQERINVQARADSSDFLPTYLTMPSQSTLDASTTALSTLLARPRIIPAFSAAGFTNNIVQFSPFGNSLYHGLALQVNRRFTNGLQFQGAYTFSHTIDDSTADFFSTVITPRRSQDFQNLRADRSNSALDHRHRFTLSAVYDTPWFKHSSWVLRNLASNFQVIPVWIYETGEWGDVQSVIDSNLNGDSAGDRSVFNPAGNPNVGSGVTPLCNSSLPSGTTCGSAASNSHLVGYLADNGNAGYITAGRGALANAGRNTLKLSPIDNIDLSLVKRFNFTERYQFVFGAQMLNAFNHPQFVAGLLNDIASFGNTSDAARNGFLNPASTSFLNARANFPSNARTIGLVAKFTF